MGRYIEVIFRRDDEDEKVFNDIQNPLSIAAFSNCDNLEKLKAETRRCQCILSRYKKKGHSFTMQSLLDFTCRYSHDPDDRNDNYNHGLNVTLHHYQLQSLQWMMEEEN